MYRDGLVSVFVFAGFATTFQLVNLFTLIRNLFHGNLTGNRKFYTKTSRWPSFFVISKLFTHCIFWAVCFE